nr:MAG TPA: hypothetical protein [Caudoviricetes sp.]
MFIIINERRLQPVERLYAKRKRTRQIAFFVFNYWGRVRIY